MKQLKSKSIPLILADLPYGTSKCKWDSVISFEPLWEQYKRIITDDGIIALFAQSPFDKILGASNIEMLKYEWVWVKSKPTGHLNAKYAPMKKHENILIFTNNATSYTPTNNNPRYYIDDLLQPYGKVIKRKYKDECVYDKNSNQSTVQKYTGHPTDVIYFDNVKKPIHPTQKPTELLEFFIKIYTKENETVLDNVMGSGSTGVACMNTNRKFIGIEKEITYCDIAKERINEVYTTGNK